MFVSDLVGKCYTERIYFVAVSRRDEVKGRYDDILLQVAVEKHNHYLLWNHEGDKSIIILAAKNDLWSKHHLFVRICYV